MISLIRNWRLILLLMVVTLLLYFGVRVRWLSARLEQVKRRAEEAEAYKRGRKMSDEVDHSIGGDPIAAREFLRNRQP